MINWDLPKPEEEETAVAKFWAKICAGITEKYQKTLSYR